MAVEDEHWSVLVSRHGFDLARRPVYQIVAHAFALFTEGLDMRGRRDYEERLAEPPPSEETWGTDARSQAGLAELDALGPGE